MRKNNLFGKFILLLKPLRQSMLQKFAFSSDIFQCMFLGVFFVCIMQYVFSERSQKVPSFQQERVTKHQKVFWFFFCQKHTASEKQSHPLPMVNKLLKIRKRVTVGVCEMRTQCCGNLICDTMSFAPCLATQLKSTLFLLLLGIFLYHRLKCFTHETEKLPGLVHLPAKQIALTRALPDVCQQKV